MMVETDVLYAFIKKSDWLKPLADELILKIKNGEFGIVYAPRETLHEIYYVSAEEKVSVDELISRVAALTSIDNLVFLNTTVEIDLLALVIMRQYGVTSIFDAYYAATALNQVSDHTVISTDEVFDKIPGLTRIHPRELLAN